METIDIELTIKNYRCFSDDKPARIKFVRGFTAFLGINNSGKSSILKFFYEFRDIFKQLSSNNLVALQRTVLVAGLSGAPQVVAFPQEIIDREEVFCNANTRDLIIQLQVSDNTYRVLRLDIILERVTIRWTCKMYLDNAPIPLDNLSFRQNNFLYYRDHPVTDLSPIIDACELLGNIVYIPSFRNMINVGATTNYYDISVGQSFISQWNHWKTGPTKRFQEIAYQVQNDLAKIFEYSRLEINASPDGQRAHMLINGKSYQISELGSGLTQFFLVLASAAMHYPRPPFILIDEPEINLHPSLQLDFLILYPFLRV